MIASDEQEILSGHFQATRARFHVTDRGMKSTVTDLPVTSRAEAIEKLEWYAMRWRIEIFHKILKSGWRAEDSNEHSKERSLSVYVTTVARFGGYLARASDPPLGKIVMWRGRARLTDIELGFTLAKLVSN
jgi:hypothetical protein